MSGGLPMKTSNFRDWTLDALDDTFGLQQVREHAVLTEWLAREHAVSPFEHEYLVGLQKTLILGVDSWNEVELENKLISPLIVFVDFDNEQFAYFLERDLQATIGEHHLIGKVDGMIAAGFRNPRVPYFCLNEYKKHLDPTGNPAAQALVAIARRPRVKPTQTPALRQLYCWS